MQQAVYELGTVQPFLPKRVSYTLAELEIYGRGYYEALAAALRVMQPAAKRWEGRMKNQERPHLVDTAADTAPRVSPEGSAHRGSTPRAGHQASDAPPAADEARDPWLRPLLILMVVAVAIFLVEAVILLGALIAHTVQ